MPRKAAPPPTPALELAVTRADADAKIEDRIVKGRMLFDARISSWEELERAEKEYHKWSSYNVELLRRLFTNESLAEEYSSWFASAVGDVHASLAEKIQEYRDGIQDKVDRLESIRERLELIPPSSAVPAVLPARTSERRERPGSSGRKIFVVHGHDEAAREAVARYIERMGLDPVVLHEQASGGRTIIEKLEYHSNVDFAVVLLTPDDVGASASSQSQLQPRARQNVILELGFFVGKVGRGRVCALHKASIELPSDMLGVVYVPLDEAGGWRLLLAKELRTAGFEVDLNNAL